MFNSLSGTLSGSGKDYIYLQCGGIEWDIGMSIRDVEALKKIPKNEECRVWIYLSHKENEMKLFGFCSAERRNIFLSLQKVDGIGPKAAVKILGGISQEELEKALETGDVDRLTAIPGLGKKTAQKMVLALKGKLVSGSTEAGGEATPYGELVNALCEMGYERKRALDALNKAASSLKTGTDKMSENDIFRKAILLLTGG
ncbi:MAG: Holliday junction branch migration protein RuvA [Termitinemataceae bacterium]|nr:MAG: Holliday junction branch migration protein RuvA [Termitinemataceae bacterium]